MLFLNAVRLLFADLTDLGVLAFDADIGVHPKQVDALCLENKLKLNNFYILKNIFAKKVNKLQI